MRKFLLWKMLPILLVLIVGWGVKIYIDNLEPTTEVASKKSSRTNVDINSSSANRNNIPKSVQQQSPVAVPQTPAPLSIPNIAPNLAPQIQPQPPQSSENSIPSFSRSNDTPPDSNYDPDKDYAEGQILVLDPTNEFIVQASAMGYRIIEQLELDALGVTALRLSTPIGMKTNIALDRLSEQFPDFIMDFDHNFETSQDQSRPLSPRRRRTDDQSGTAMEQMKARNAGNQSRARMTMGWQNLPETCGSGIRIGLIDTALDLSHPALRGQRITTRVAHDPRARSGPANHGTSIAAMLVGVHSPKGWGGLIPGAELFAANIFEIAASGKSVARASSLLRAINWLSKRKISVVNVGLTGSNNKTVRKAMFIAKEAGMVVVAAAGNRGWKKRRAYPAGYTDVISVTAVGPYRGIMRNANRGSYIDFAAPGVRIWTAVPGGGKYKSGTSYATTYITALLALEIHHGKPKNPRSLRNILADEIIDLGQPGKDDTYGWGFIKKYPKC